MSYRGVGRGCGVGRGLGVALGVAVGVAVAEGVGVGVVVATCSAAFIRPARPRIDGNFELKKFPFRENN